ncbi:MAG: GNAT family N-acetyltransferase [Actinomycetota bacterium]|nr:GNAT family N-acetyltransferase [Actinomycetota bacterium]
MSFVLTADAAAFQARAGQFIESRPQANVLATILLAILEGRYAHVRPVFGCQLDGDGTVTAAAIRTPPRSLITTELSEHETEPMLEAWLREDPGLPGVNGPPATVCALAAGWQRGVGGTARLGRSMAMHSLQRVLDPARPPSGRLRHAEHSERDRLITWWQAFITETSHQDANDAEAMVDARLDHDAVFVWDDGGAVSLVAVSPRVAGIVRIGPVYTPPERRRRGYAGMAVAEVSREALHAGARGCMLFTDLDNPTSNRIYAEIGYRRFADWAEYVFEH